MQKDEGSLFEGVETTLASLSAFAGPRPPKDLTEGLKVITNAALSAQKAFDNVSDAATLKPILDGLFAIRVLRRTLRTLPIDDAARFEIEFRLRQKEGEFQQAALLAGAVKIEALADDGVVVPGQPVKVNVIVANHGAADVTVKQVNFAGFDGAGRDAPCTMTAFSGGGFFFGGRGRGATDAAAAPAMSSIRKDQVAHCEPTLKIPGNARISEPYWHRAGESGRYTFDADAPFGLPMRPTPFYVQVTLAMPGGEEVISGLPVEHRYEGNIFSGEKRTELLVVPALSVRVSPQIAVVTAAAIRTAPAVTSTGGRGRPPARPSARAGAAATRGAGPPNPPKTPAPPPRNADAPSANREVRVTVVNDTPDAIESVVHLEASEGWTATPDRQTVKFTRGDESQTIRFDVRPAPGAGPGEARVRAIAESGGQTFDRGYEVIEYPHIRRYHIYDPAETMLKVIDVRVPANLTVGYIAGVGDQVPTAIEQLGAKVQMITPDDLAWGDLSRFDAIVTGVRAYERRDDLRANNSRLLEYVSDGGTAIVQYNKFEFNDAQYGPYPAHVSTDRITNENAPPRIMGGGSALLTRPNEINEATWRNWVQERGLYFLAPDKDSRYHDVLEFDDDFPYNKGPKTGSLVEAAYGKGKWIYVALGLWRQLPAGTEGAYQLLANLISAGKLNK